MGKTQFSTCVDIIKKVKVAGYEDQVGWMDLLPFIREVAGSSPYTLKVYRKELVVFGLLETDNQVIFRLTEKARLLAK